MQSYTGVMVAGTGLEGKPVLTNCDPVNEAGGPRRLVVRQFQDVEVESPLDLCLSATAGTTLLSGVAIIAR